MGVGRINFDHGIMHIVINQKNLLSVFVVFKSHTAFIFSPYACFWLLCVYGCQNCSYIVLSATSAFVTSALTPLLTKASVTIMMSDGPQV
jgi:hypothetical protein